jgi:hypothetical protein
MAQSSPMPILTALLTDANAIRRMCRIKLLSLTIAIPTTIEQERLNNIQNPQPEL